MSRILLVGTGVPSLIACDRHHGPGVRMEHLATALVRDGHDVELICVVSEQELASLRLCSTVRIEDREFPIRFTTEADLKRQVLPVQDPAPQAVVGVTAMGAAMALPLVGDLPLWADIFGDTMAEAQSKAAAYRGDAALVRFWGLLVPALERADRFSVVSQPQADALIGQLGLVGRLGASTVGEDLVHTIACAAEARSSADREQARALRNSLGLQSAFVVLWSGGFNTWCDVETLFCGLESAMRDVPDLYFVGTGGALPGHDDVTYENFRALVAASEFSDRFLLRGWVPVEELPAYYAMADLGVNIERVSYERRLGSENRVAQWLAAGLPVVTTAQSALGRTLSAANAGVAIAPARPQELAAAIHALRGDRARLACMTDAARNFALDHLGYATTAAPLLAWARTPIRAGDAGCRPMLRVGLVSQPQTMVDLLEAYLAELSLWQVARRSIRWIWRRLRS